MSNSIGPAGVSIHGMCALTDGNTSLAQGGQPRLSHCGDLLHLEGADHLVIPSHINQRKEVTSSDGNRGSPEAIDDPLRHLRRPESQSPH